MFLKKEMKNIGFVCTIPKCYIYTSVLVSHFDLKKNEKLLFSNIKIIKDEKTLLKNTLNFLKNFESFASVCCGCTDPKNKTQLKRSIWFSSIGLEMKEFLKFYNTELEDIKDAKLNILKEIIKIQCPIILKDKNTVLIESEISPKKIVNSSKRMRYFFNISEVYTCRSCFQKNKCKRFLQKYTGNPDFSDFTRVMIGFYNICKMYIKRNETDKKELIPFVEKTQYFHFVLFYIYNFLLKHKAFNYNNVEEGNRNLILKYLKEKRRNMFLVKSQLAQEKILNIPKEYSNTMIPTDKAKMKKKQKNIFLKIQKLRKKEKIPEDEEKFIWVEENEDDVCENEEAENSKNIQGTENSDNISDLNTNNIFLNDKNNIYENKDFIEIQNQNQNQNHELSCFRFKYFPSQVKELSAIKNVNYNKIYNTYARKLQEKVYVNLDDMDVKEEEITQCEDILFHIPQQIGGYKFINYVETSPNNSIFPINENLYEGIQVYKKEEINIDALWTDVENEELNIKKIGFFDPFSIKKFYDSTKYVNKKKEEANGDTDDITELNEDLTSFEESLYMTHKENVKRHKKNIYSKTTNKISAYKPEDDEDERFEYFKKLKNENIHFDKHAELKEEFQMGTYDNRLYNETEKSYKHTFNIRRKLNDEQKDLKTFHLKEIEEEKKELTEDNRRELQDNFYMVFKNLKFPSLDKKPLINNNKNSALELKKKLKWKNEKKKI